MQTFLQDLAYGWRGLARNRGFAAVAVLSLALGIGANGAIFSFINGVLLRPLPIPQPDQLIAISEENPARGTHTGVVSPRNLEEWEQQSQTIAAFGAWRDWRFSYQAADGAQLVSSAIASPTLFTVLGGQPALGRYFLSEENQRGRDHVVLLSYSYWQTQFGGAGDILDRHLLLDDESFRIIGVLPSEFEELALGRYKIWAPLSIDPDQLLGRHVRNRQVYARLQPGASLTTAQAEMISIAQRLAQQYPKENGGWTVEIVALHDQLVGDVRPALLTFMAAVGFILLIACANVANLSLARVTARRKELAIRSALGANRFRLIRQLMTESLLLSLLGGVLGIGLAVWLVDIMVALSPITLPRTARITIDTPVTLFTFALSILTGLLFGIVPGLHSTRIGLVEELKAGERGSFVGLKTWVRGVLVIGQVALAFVLLIGAGLLSRTFVSLLTMQAGFNPNHLLTAQLFVPQSTYTEDSQVAALYQRATKEFSTIPGVESVGAVSATAQFGGYEPVEFLPEGAAASPTGDYPQARYYDASPNLFHTLQMPLRSGREFSEADKAGAPAVAIVNETLARRFWPDEDAVGKHIQLVHSKTALEIVGVVGDMKRYGLNAKVEPEIYWPYLQQPRWAIYFIFRTTTDPNAIIPEIRQRINRLDATVQVVNVATLDQMISRSLGRPRFNLFVLGTFALTALLLAVVGLYGVLSYTVTQSTKEIGIRLALGAQRRDIFNLLIGQGMGLTMIGLGLGLIAALSLTHLLSSLLFNISTTDPATFILVALILSLVAALACWLPARRATKVNPMIVLRHE